MKRTGFKFKPRKPLRRTPLRVVGHSTTTELKNEIQALLRQIVILRDGGCILRHFKNEINPQYQECGDFRKDGQLILQAEHLHSRNNASSFSDTRLIVCICRRHHIFYKRQYPDEYYKLVKKHIGTIRSILLERVQNDHTPYKIDLKLEKIALEKELQKYHEKRTLKN